MADQPIAHHPPVNVAILNFRQRRGGTQGSATQPRRVRSPCCHPIASAHVREKRAAIVPSRRSRWPSWSDGPDTGASPAAVMAEVDSDVASASAIAAHHLVTVAEPWLFFGAHINLRRAALVEQIEDFQRGTTGRGAAGLPLSPPDRGPSAYARCQLRRPPCAKSAAARYRTDTGQRRRESRGYSWPPRSSSEAICLDACRR